MKFKILIFILVLAGIGLIALKYVTPRKNSPAVSSVLPSPQPTIVPTITPTPSLTPEQIAKIARKKFDDLNAKYGPCKNIPILMYHHVMPADQAKSIGASSLNVSPDIFRGQIDYLVGKGYQAIGLNQLMPMLSTGSLPAKPVVLTFDDGYLDFYNFVFPILIEKNIRATVFVISQFTGGERYLTWSQISELAGSGLVLIGNHTLNHPWLSKLERAEENNQIVSAKNIIEQNTGIKTDLFAYPYGNSNDIAKEILKENGFAGAVTTVSGWTQCANLPYDLQRIRIGGAVLSRYGL